jgi:hypothetical protein
LTSESRLQPDRFISSAIETWRYLRVAMIVMIAGLGVSVGYERAHAHVSCFQTSISAYYYTPVRGVFVASLVALGLCMVCLKGNTDAEDILLNLAGMFAPVVAFVPTPHVGSCPPSTMAGLTGLSPVQRSALEGGADPDIANNIFTLLVVGVIALGIVGYFLIAARWRSRPVRWQAWAGYGAAVAVYIAAVILFNAQRHWFNGNAHTMAAALLFLCVIAVVLIDAVDYRDKNGQAHLVNRYSVIAAAMVGSAGIILIVKWSTDWQHWQLFLEAALITLFAAFWVLQTLELGNQGLRSTERVSARAST